MQRLRRESPIPDELSPDRSTCEHCGVAISFDDLGYTHDDTGFGECHLVLSDSDGGCGLFVVDPETSGGGETTAEPVEWFVDG